MALPGLCFDLGPGTTIGSCAWGLKNSVHNEALCFLNKSSILFKLISVIKSHDITITSDFNFSSSNRNVSAVPRSSFEGNGKYSTLIFRSVLSIAVCISARWFSNTTTITSKRFVDDINYNLNLIEGLPVNLDCCSFSKGYHMRGLLPTGKRHFGLPAVSSGIREPFPAARITAWNSGLKSIFVNSIQAVQYSLIHMLVCKLCQITVKNVVCQNPILPTYQYVVNTPDFLPDVLLLNNLRYKK